MIFIYIYNWTQGAWIQLMTNDTFKKLGVLRSALRMVFGSWSWFGHVKSHQVAGHWLGIPLDQNSGANSCAKGGNCNVRGVGRLSQPCLHDDRHLLGFVLLSYFLWESLQETMVLTCLCFWNNQGLSLLAEVRKVGTASTPCDTAGAAISMVLTAGTASFSSLGTGQLDFTVPLSGDSEF